MGEIINHPNAPSNASHLLTACNTLEACKPLPDLIRTETRKACRANSHRRIAHIKLAGHRQHVMLTIQHKAGVFAIIDNLRDLQVTLRPQAHGGDRSRPITCHVHGIDTVTIDKGHAISRHNIKQPFKGQLDLIKRVVDICMVKLDVIDHDHFGKIMQELGSFIKEGGVVFVAFKNHKIRVGKGCPLAKITRNATDHVTWIDAG